DLEKRADGQAQPQPGDHPVGVGGAPAKDGGPPEKPGRPGDDMIKLGGSHLALSISTIGDTTRTPRREPSYFGPAGGVKPTAESAASIDSRTRKDSPGPKSVARPSYVSWAHSSGVAQ